MNQNELIIYHGNCPDGFTAAWVAHRALRHSTGRDAELFKGSYGDDPPYELAKGRIVYVVDFSYPRAKLLQLRASAAALVVLDHHKTAQADLEGLDDFCEFDMNRSGAGLTWDHFHQGTPRPWLVSYVEDRDLWRFALPNSEQLSLRIRLTPHDLDAYDALAAQREEDVLAEAEGAKIYLDHYVQDALRNAYVLADVFEDEAVRCVNVSYTGISDVLHGALQLGFVNVALGWHVSETGHVACSLRSKQGYDCSRFAKAYGGGGHAQASGFRLAPDSPLAQRLFTQQGRWVDA